MADNLAQILKKAATLESSNSIELAADVYLSASKKYPKSPEVWFKLGSIQCVLKNFDAAVNSFNKCLALTPNQPTAHLLLGKIFHIQAKHKESIASLQTAVTLAPDLVEANYLLGISHLEHNNLTQAAKYLGNVWQLQPNTPGVWQKYAGVLSSLGNLPGAIQVYEKQLAINTLGKHHLGEFVPDRNHENHKDEAVTIATSIAPRGLENQKKAIDSWKRQGFNVISINSQPEIDQLQSEFNDVTFCKVSRSAIKTYGKPYVYFDDVLKFLGESNANICGIVNSDIHLLDDRLHSYVKKEAENSFLYGCRVDIPSLDDLNGHVYAYGFDYYFFDSQLLSMYPKDEFCIGLPWWDYWAALVPALRGVPTKKLTTPVAYHITHETNWVSDSWVKYAKHITNYIDPNINPNADTTNSYSNYIWYLIENHCSAVSII